MKKKYTLWSIYFTLFFVSAGNLVSEAQNNKALIQTAFQNEKSKQNWQDSDISEWKINSEHKDKSSGITHAYVQQMHNGIPVYNAISVFAFKQNSVASFKPGIIKKVKEKANASSASITPKTAIESAARHLELAMTSSPQLIKSDVKTNQYEFDVPELSANPVKVQLLYLPNNNKLKLAWDVSIELKGGQHWWNVRIDATSGIFLDKNDYVTECNFGDGHNHFEHQGTISPLMVTSPQPAWPVAPPPGNTYNVYPLPIEAPSYGNRSLQSDPSDPAASPFGWHDTDGVAGAEYTITRGNNVYAYEDQDSDNSPGYSPDGGAELVFDFPLDFNQPPASSMDASLSNLFYVINSIHDKLHALGFDEAAGNFAVNNYGRGGEGNDPVIAEGLDGEGFNNANFATPPDGFSGRMQMFLWSGPDCSSLNIASAGFTGAMTMLKGAFSPDVSVTAEVILMDDGVAPTSNGCEPPIIDLTGKIVLLDRGVCAFVSKVLAAQAAGAVGVIVANNNPNGIIVMGGSGPVTIPAVMVSMADGNILKNALLGGVVNATLVTCSSVDLDGSLDNGIVAHEFGHGVSNRLTGGPANSGCLSNGEQAGEGWSDWLALIMTIEPGDNGTNARPIGSYASSGGIRRYPYSTDMNVNPQTYADLVISPQVHAIGEIWCSAIWDMTWLLIDQHGYSSDPTVATAGNNIAMRLVLEGMKLQPCGPGFLDSRDAILLADKLLYNDEHRCQIGQAFARRGMGSLAEQGSADIAGDEKADFSDYFCIPCAGIPFIGTPTSTATEVCSLDEFTLKLPTPAITIGNTYQWQSSPDNSTWTNIEGASDLQFTGTQTAATWYQCVVTCTNGGTSNSSSPLFIDFLTDCIKISNSVVTKCSGNFLDSGGLGSNYSDYENYTQTFMPESGKKVQLAWKYFDSEQFYDFITIYDGPDASYPVLFGPASGMLKIPAFIASDPSGALTVKFTSDEFLNNPGWNAEIRCVTGCPTPVAAGLISGPAAVCANITGVVYTVDDILDATQYVWTLPAGMSPVDGVLTTEINSITIETNSSYKGGSITVYGMNLCGDGPVSPAFETSKLTKVPSIPSAISGLNGNVYGYCGGSTVKLTTSSDNADTYNWTVSAGTILGGQGTGTIYVLLNNSYSSCYVTVTASNCIGTGSQRKLTLKSVLPEPSISGASVACKYGNAVQTYVVSTEGTASSFTWSSTNSNIKFSDGISTANPLTTTSTSVNVNYAGVALGNHSLSVTANNSCGSSKMYTLKVTVKNCTKSGETELTSGDENAFSVYPNPTSDLVTVNFNSNVGGKYSVKLSDMNGKVVILEYLDAIIGNNEYKCLLGDLAPGLYSLVIQTDDATFQSRIIKK